MSLKEKLELVLEANIGQFTSGMERAGESAEKNLAKADGSMQKVGGRMQVTGAAMIGFGAVAVGAMGKAAEAYGKAEMSNIKLENAVHNSTHSVGESIAPFKDLAEKLQQTTEFSHTATEGMMAYLIGTGRTKDETLALTPAIQDLAVKMGGDLDGAAKKVTLALNGKKKGLEALVGPLDATMFATDRYGAVMKALATTQGLATEQGKTFDGQLEIMKNNLKELEEGVGKGATEAFSNMFGAISSVTGALDSLSPGTQDAIGQFVTYGGVLLIAGGAMTMLVGTMVKQATAVMGAVGSIGSHIAALFTDTAAAEADAAANEAAAASMAMLAVPILAVGAAFVYGETHAESFSLSLKGVADPSKAVADNFDKITAAANLTDTSTYDVAKTIAEQSIPAAIAYADKLDAQGKSSDDARRAITDFKQALIDKKAADEAATKAVQEATDTTDGYTTAIKALHDEMHAELDPMFAAQKALEGNTKAVADAEAATWKHQAAIDAATEATAKYGAGSKEANDANLVVIQTEDALQASNMKVAESALSVHDATQKLTQAMSDGTVSIDGAKQQLSAWVAQGLMTQSQADQVAYALAGVANRADALDGRNIVMGLTLDVGQANAELNSIATRTGGGVARFDVGGEVPGSRGAPLPAIVHGGEYVMTADMVDAVKSGQGWSGRPMPMTDHQPAGNTYNFHIVAPSADAREVQRLVEEHLATV